MIVPEHRPSYYVRCDVCGGTSGTVVGNEESAWRDAATHWGFRKARDGAHCCSTRCLAMHESDLLSQGKTT